VPSPSEIARGDDNTKPSNPKDAVGSRKVGISNLPVPPLMEAAAALTEGSLKYGRHNYRDVGVRASVYYDAAFRHLGAWWEGEDIDAESGLSHVSKAIAGLLVLRDSMMSGNWQDDRPPRPQQGFVQEANDRVAAMIDARPDPVPPFIEEGPKELGYGAPKHYVVEVQLPVEGSPEGYQWHQIGGPRMLGVAMGASQDLFEEQYEGKRAVRIMGVCDVYERSRDGVAVATGGVTLELHSIKFP
jgi:hypothetical protein